jgi:hypothetical protein
MYIQMATFIMTDDIHLVAASLRLLKLKYRYRPYLIIAGGSILVLYHLAMMIG